MNTAATTFIQPKAQAKRSVPSSSLVQRSLSEERAEDAPMEITALDTMDQSELKKRGINRDSEQDTVISTIAGRNVEHPLSTMKPSPNFEIMPLTPAIEVKVTASYGEKPLASARET